MHESFDKKILRFMGNYILPGAVNVLCNTLQITIKNSEAVKTLENNNQNYVLAFWHGKMAIGWYINRKKNFAALVSQSKDGDILANVLEKWKYNVARGSSHKGGKQSLEQLLQYAKTDYSLAITPDGPTGPAKQMKAGAVVSAKKAGIPLVLAGIHCFRKKVFNSWDSFEIPKPFSKVNVVYSNPIYIEQTKTYKETSKIIEQCQLTLNQLNKKAEEFC